MVRPVLVLATVAVAVVLCFASVEGGVVRREREVVAEEQNAESKMAKCVQDSKTERAVVNCLSEALGGRINKEQLIDWGWKLGDGLPAPIQPGLGGKIQQAIDKKMEAAKDALRVWAHDPNLLKP